MSADRIYRAASCVFSGSPNGYFAVAVALLNVRSV